MGNHKPLGGNMYGMSEWESPNSSHGNHASHIVATECGWHASTWECEWGMGVLQLWMKNMCGMWPLVEGLGIPTLSMDMDVSMNDRGTISDPISLPNFWLLRLRRLRQNSFFTEILWNFLYRIKRDAPPAPPRIPQKFHNFLDFYTAPPKFTHAPPKFTHFRSMSSGDMFSMFMPFMLLARIIFSHYRPWFNLFILNCRSHSLFRFIEDRSLFQLCISHLFLFLVFDVIISFVIT